MVIQGDAKSTGNFGRRLLPEVLIVWALTIQKEEKYLYLYFTKIEAHLRMSHRIFLQPPRASAHPGLLLVRCRSQPIAE